MLFSFLESTDCKKDVKLLILPKYLSIKLKSEKKKEENCSSNATNNLTSKKQKLCSFCYRHCGNQKKKRMQEV